MTTSKIDPLKPLKNWSKEQFRAVVESVVLVGLSNGEIANATGATRSTVVRWINGEVCPHPRMREPVIRALVNLRDGLRPEIRVRMHIQVIEEEFIGNLCRDRHPVLTTEIVLRQGDLPRVLEHISKLKVER